MNRCINETAMCEKVNSACVVRDKDLPSESNLRGCEVGVNQVIDELYSFIKDLKKEVSDLKNEKKIVDVKVDYTKIQACDLKITDCVNVPQLDPCGEKIETLGQLLNYLINRQ